MCPPRGCRAFHGWGDRDWIRRLGKKPSRCLATIHRPSEGLAPSASESPQRLPLRKWQTPLHEIVDTSSSGSYRHRSVDHPPRNASHRKDSRPSFLRRPILCCLTFEFCRLRGPKAIASRLRRRVWPHGLALRVLVTKATRMARASMGRPVYTTSNMNASRQKLAFD